MSSDLSLSSTVRLLRNPAALTACSRRLSAILTALRFIPSNQNPLCLFHVQRERYSHSIVSLRHRSGNAIYPLKRGLFPRHLRAEKTRFFVHARIPDGSSRHAGRKGKKSFKKIVQICALLCIEIIALEEGVLAHFYSFDAGGAANRCPPKSGSSPMACTNFCLPTSIPNG